MKNENYITIQGWMVNELQLSGNELILYALIYGFSQDGESKFEGAAKYLADSLRVSKRATLSILNALVRKGYIKKYKQGIGRSKTCDYAVNIDSIKDIDVQKNSRKGEKTSPKEGEKVKKLHQKGEETSHHNNMHTDLDHNIRGSSNEPPLTEYKKTAIELSDLLLTSHRKEYPDFLSGKTDGEIKKKINSWADDIEKLIRIDKKSPEIIKQVVLWVKTPGKFWFHNIESGKKLRLQFERLYGQMVDEQKKQTSPPRHKIAADNMPTEDVSKYFKEAI